MSTTPFRPGPCTAPPFPPAFCCRFPHPPWPEHIPLAPALYPRQWRRGPDGICQVLSVDEHHTANPGRCEVGLYDVDGRHVTNVRSVWSMTILYAEVLPGPPELFHVVDGEHRRAEGGVIVEVHSPDVFGEFRLRAVDGAAAEETTQIQGRTYSPREVWRLFPDKLTHAEMLELDARGRAVLEARVRRPSVMRGGAAILAVTMMSMLALTTERDR